MTRCLAPEPIAYKPHPIDWDGWEEERQRYGAYKEPHNPKKRNLRYLTHAGKTQTPRQWCEELSLAMQPQTLWHRVAILNWTFEEAASTPLHHAPITYQGKTQGLLAWSHELKISQSTLWHRLQQMGLSVEEAFGSKSRICKLRITYLGETKPLQDWAKALGFTRQILYSRIYVSGWDIERAFNTPSRQGNLASKKHERPSCRQLVQRACSEK